VHDFNMSLYVVQSEELHVTLRTAEPPLLVVHPMDVCTQSAGKPKALAAELAIDPYTAMDETNVLRD